MSTPPRIIIAGAPASGKGTQCEFIRQEFKVVHISTGDILRDEISRESSLGKEAKKYMDNGDLVPDSVMVNMILSRLQQRDCIERGWLLDGFPRTKEQAEALIDAGINCDCFIRLNVPESVLVERVVGRRLDPETGKIYHMKYFPPENEKICSRLIQRPDDTEEKLKTRINAFNSNMSSIQSIFNSTLCEIDGDRDPKAIWKDLAPKIKFMTNRSVGVSPPRIIIAGAPASGKGTQCEFIKNEFNVVHLSTGDILRQAIGMNSPLGNEAKKYMDKGELVPDVIIIAVILDRLKQRDCVSRGWLLDGFPRTKEQAVALTDAGITCDCFVYLKVPESVLVERVVGRRVDPETGKIYHMKYSPPETDDVRARLVQRSDDTEEKLMVRLAAFDMHMSSILDFYADKKLEVDGNRNTETIWRELAPSLRRATQRSIIFVVGGPCCGKHTHCVRIEEQFGLRYLNLQDLIRQEIFHDSDIAQDIEYFIQKGDIIPSDIIVKLIIRAVARSEERDFIIDAFPRNVNDIKTWYNTVDSQCAVKFMVYLKCPEDIVQHRLGKRLQKERDGDNISAIAKRFRLFYEQTLPVIDMFRRCGKVREVDATSPESIVFDKLTSLIEAQRLLPPYERSVLVIKPDAVKNGYIPAILDMISSQLHLAVISTRFSIFNDDVVDVVCKEHLLDPSYSNLKSFMKSGPSLIVVVEGTDAIRRLKNAMGDKDASIAMQTAPNTFRGRFGRDKYHNACQCSMSEPDVFTDIDFWLNPSRKGAMCAVEGQPTVEDPNNGSGEAVVTEDTLALIKPCSSELHYRSIVSILLGHGFQIIAESRLNLTEKIVNDVYSHRVGTIPYVSFKKYITSGPVIALQVRRDSAIKGLRHLIGPDDMTEIRTVRQDSIRALFATDRVVNAIESSDSAMCASKEIAYYFPMSCRATAKAVTTQDTPVAPRDPTRHAEKVRIAARRRKKNAAPSPISLARHTDMLQYLSDDVNPVLKDLVHRILVQRPRDVLGFAIKDLIEQQRLSLEERGRSKGGAKLQPINSGSKSPTPISVSSSTSVLPAISSKGSPVTQETPSKGYLDDFFLQEDDVTVQPTFNGHPLTVDIARSEIMRLRDTIKTISENICAEKTQPETSASSSTEINRTKSIPAESPQPPRKVNFCHFGDMVGFSRVFKDLLVDENHVGKFIATLKHTNDCNPLILFSGNFLGCTDMFTCPHIASMFRLLNVAGVNYAILGNRDFEFGIAVLENHIRNSLTTWVLSNVIDKSTQKPLLNCEPDVLVEWNGVMVGIIGIVDSWICDTAGQFDYNVEFLDIFKTAKNVADDLRRRGAEVVIAVTHCSRQRVDEKLSSIDGIDVVFGGHSKTFETWNLDGGIGLKSPAGLGSLTKVAVTVSEEETVSVQWPPGIVTVHSDTAANSTANGIIQELWEIRVKAMMKPIGATIVRLDGQKHLVRTAECALGNMLADILRYHTNATFAFINAGAIRLDGIMEQGLITVGDISRMLPFFDYVTTVKITGKQLLAILKNSVSRTPNPDGRFLHISGLSLEYTTDALPPDDPSASKCRYAKVGKKVIDTTVTYTCALTGHILEGNDGYSFLKEVNVMVDKEFCMSIQQIVFDFFRKRSLVENVDERRGSEATVNDFEPVGPVVGHRINVIVTKYASSYYTRTSTIGDDSDEDETDAALSKSVVSTGAVGGDEADEGHGLTQGADDIDSPTRNPNFRTLF